MLFGAKMVLCALAFSFAIQHFIFTTNKIIDYYNIFLNQLYVSLAKNSICCGSIFLIAYQGQVGASGRHSIGESG
jgi:hypothetical protein